MTDATPRPTRRNFLRGTGGLLLALPYLEGLAGRAAAQAAPRKRFVSLQIGHGGAWGADMHPAQGSLTESLSYAGHTVRSGAARDRGERRQGEPVADPDRGLGRVHLDARGQDERDPRARPTVRRLPPHRRPPRQLGHDRREPERPVQHADDRQPHGVRAGVLRRRAARARDAVRHRQPIDHRGVVDLREPDRQDRAGGARRAGGQQPAPLRPRLRRVVLADDAGADAAPLDRRSRARRLPAPARGLPTLGARPPAPRRAHLPSRRARDQDDAPARDVRRGRSRRQQRRRALRRPLRELRARRGAHAALARRDRDRVRLRHEPDRGPAVDEQLLRLDAAPARATSTRRSRTRPAPAPTRRSRSRSTRRTPASALRKAISASSSRASCISPASSTRSAKATPRCSTTR